MKPEVAKRLRLLASAVSVLVVIAVLLVLWILWRVRASLPQFDGAAAVPGLSADVSVARDALGVPTVRAQNRVDAARALGWLHAQERFFQMDLLRRSPAGELAALFGKRALPRDRAMRIHGFRKLARAVIGRLPAHERALVEAYAEGVNAGLAALRERPWEYLVLREQPQPWLPEDSILVIYAMTVDLQDENAVYERSLMALRDRLGREALAFFAPLATPNDAALDGTTGSLAPMPGPELIDLRKRRTVSWDGDGGVGRPRPTWREEGLLRGSNAFALAGAHTASGAALLANDMHLDHGVPNTWYRASLEYEDRKITGVTLPGVPAVVAGSNGHVAWGFTASYTDTVDLVVVETDSIAHTLYRAPGHEGLVSMEVRKETIAVRGEDPEEVEYQWTLWGPIIGTNEDDKPLALRWIAHDPEATNLGLMKMEQVTTVAEAIDVAHRAGMPAQNIMLADKSGEIAWTIAGRLPKRIGYDGRLPVTFAYGDRRWEGYLEPDDVPVVRGRDSALAGRLWSANHRHVGGDAGAKLGDGAMRRAPRAAQIRDDLAPLTAAAPRDLLAVQLDDRALFLERWHGLLMETLTPAATEGNKARTRLRGFAEKWEGRASVDAVSYRIVREFRAAVYNLVFPPIFAPCVQAFPQFDARDFQLEGAVWTLLREQPPHLIDPKFANWNELLVAAVDDVLALFDEEDATLPQANWGWRNRARIRHPFSYSFPWLSRWIDMPRDPLPGGDDMPRVQSPGHGASERFVVSPGREHEGIFHMPCGQSAHPLSPFFRAGHEAWVRGEPTPFLPGETKHTLTLSPQ